MSQRYFDKSERSSEDGCNRREFILLTATSALAGYSGSPIVKQDERKEVKMAHEPKSYPLEGKLDGISDNQLQQHRDVLYKNYVNKLNEIEDTLKTVDRSKANGIYSAFRGLKTEETFALNGVVLHELYFENLGGKGGRSGGRIAELMNRDFGSYDKWFEDYKACGASARGWVVLAYSLYDGKLHNYLTDTHHFHFPVLALPLLVLDVYEHAYMIDYGVKRPPYLEAFSKNINWDVVNNRIEMFGKLIK